VAKLVRIGTRTSKLALWQTEKVKRDLQAKHPDIEIEIVEISTVGDEKLDVSLSKIGDKGLFTKELETAIFEGRIDCAVHSLKDLPTILPDGLSIGAVTEREMPNDVLVSKGARTIDELPTGALVATGSLRRTSQLLSLRPDLRIIGIRGNVPTRVSKFKASDCDGMVLAFAGLKRPLPDADIGGVIPVEQLVPAVGQGIIAVEIRSEDAELRDLLSSIEDSEARVFGETERAFLRTLEGGCQVPIGALATKIDGNVSLSAFIGAIDGSNSLRGTEIGEWGQSEDIGFRLANRLLAEGGDEILEQARKAAGEMSGETL
jgi:hydroxymethylbilane synthase